MKTLSESKKVSIIFEMPLTLLGFYNALEPQCTKPSGDKFCGKLLKFDMIKTDWTCETCNEQKAPAPFLSGFFADAGEYCVFVCSTITSSDDNLTTESLFIVQTDRRNS
jgi:hypothetical protein